MKFLYQKDQKLGIIHFIGIGGIGISGIAKVMHDEGYKVQGSDLKSNYNTQQLEKMGVKVFYDHSPQNIKGANFVVISSAISKDNVEVKEAIANYIPVIRRDQMLAEVMRFKNCIAVSGSHGKTTTTSMIGHIFEQANIYPTVINGGIINNKSTNAYTGNSNWLIAEADESDATFIHIPATIAVITNIDPEHLDYYKNFENLINSFHRFIHNLPFYGCAVACIDNKIVKNLVKDVIDRKIITYGIANLDANVTAFNIKNEAFSSIFDVKINWPGEQGSSIIEQIVLSVPGNHNILNALAAISVAIELNFGLQVIKNAFKNFEGVKRRFNNVGKYKDIIIIDDYAHHPEEIKTTLAAARNLANLTNSKLIALCQPHRYSRVVSLMDEFVQSFDVADEVYITPIYSAGEKNLTNISNSDLVNKINRSTAYCINKLEDIASTMHKYENEKVVLVGMGAGDITYYINKLKNDFQSIK